MNRLPLLCALCLLTLTACSTNHTASPPEDDASGWMLESDKLDAGQRDMATLADASDLSGETPDASTDQAPEPDFAASDASEPDFTGNDASESDLLEPFDAGSPDLDLPDSGDAGQPDMPQSGMVGDGCGNSNECSSGLVCCAGFSGQFSCTEESQCFTGGLCEVSDDCPSMQECCDLSQFGVQQNVCRDRCSTMGGGGMNGCMNNSECTGSDEVCCPSFQGAAMCTPSSQCQTGGSCAIDSDCLNGQLCCDFFGQAAICLDQCPF